MYLPHTATYGMITPAPSDGEGLSMKCGFQINLDVQDRVCLVIGGEEEATGRVNRLLEAGGKVTVIHPSLTGFPSASFFMIMSARAS